MSSKFPYHTDFQFDIILYIYAIICETATIFLRNKSTSYTSNSSQTTCMFGGRTGAGKYICESQSMEEISCRKNSRQSEYPTFFCPDYTIVAPQGLVHIHSCGPDYSVLVFSILYGPCLKNSNVLTAGQAPANTSMRILLHKCFEQYFYQYFSTKSIVNLLVIVTSHLGHFELRVS